jgi:hypothetical protein
MLVAIEISLLFGQLKSVSVDQRNLYYLLKPDLSLVQRQIQPFHYIEHKPLKPWYRRHITVPKAGL